MLLKLLFLLPLAVAVLANNTTNNGVQYDGPSNVQISPTYRNYQPQRVTLAPPVENSVAPVATRPAIHSFPSQNLPGYRPALQPRPINLGSQPQPVIHQFEPSRQPEVAPTREPTRQPEVILVPTPAQAIPQPEPSRQPEVVPTQEPTRQPEVILVPTPVQAIPQPEPSRQPEVVPTQEPTRQPEVILVPTPAQAIPQPEPSRQPEVVPTQEPTRQPEVILVPTPVQAIPQPEPSRQPEMTIQAQTTLSSVIIRQPQDTLQPQPSPVVILQQQPTIQPTATEQMYTLTPPPKAPVSQGTLLPLLPKQESVREPVFGRPTHPTPTVYYPTSSYNTPYPPNQYTRPPQVANRVPPTVLPTLPPQVVTRIPPQIVTQTPPAVVFVTPRPRPTGPFKTEFQCPESNGFYSVANSCDAYFECKGYVAERRTCPNGLYFNPAAKYSNYSPCAYPSEVQCTAGNVIQRPQPNPTGQCPASSGSFAINDGDCSRFIMCQEGLATIMNCPTGLVFNDQVQSCDWPVNVPQCTPTVFKDFSCPAPPVEKNGEMSDIVYKYRYGAQCKSFVACQKGRPRLLSCDPGLAFDETSQSCINDELVTNCATPYTAAVV